MQILVIHGRGISCEIVLRWFSLDLTDDKSTLVQVMAWCRQATSHYLSQCWPRSVSAYGVTRPQGVKTISWKVAVLAVGKLRIINMLMFILQLCLIGNWATAWLPIPSNPDVYIYISKIVLYQTKRIQSSAIIVRPNIIRYYINNYGSWGRILIKYWIHKKKPYLALMGQLWDVFCEYLQENWLHYSGTALCEVKHNLYA